RPPRGSVRRARGRRSWQLLSAQPADARGRGLARGLARGPECVADVLVAEVVAVTEEYGRTLLLRELCGQAAELLVRERLVDRLEVGDVRGGDPLAPAEVDRDV